MSESYVPECNGMQALWHEHGATHAIKAPVLAWFLGDEANPRPVVLGGGDSPDGYLLADGSVRSTDGTRWEHPDLQAWIAHRSEP